MTPLFPTRSAARMFELSIFKKQKGGQLKSMDSAKLIRYRCMTCSRERSSTYHSRHPPEKPRPPPGVCRRCKKEQLEEQLKEQLKEKLKEHPPTPPAITIHEFHHYHHTCTCRHELPSASTPVETLLPPYPGCVELPAENMRGRSRSPHQLFERVPPPVKFWTKPSYRGH